MQLPKEKYSIVFLPWFKLDREYSFTDVRLIPWRECIGKLVNQRFVYGDNMISLHSYKRDSSTLDGGYKYEDLNILAPVWVRQCHQFDIDEKLLKSIEVC